ncbi:hypothetical protein [Qipengyuania sp.]|uniref:hypothetical protein n=1 Tax=Qipengyuania sp. TaxID=2004515 RepID=UPI0035C85D24
MISLEESEQLDRREIAQTTGLGLPDLPSGWKVSDVQLFPSDLGNSLTVTLITQRGEHLSLFAARAETPAEELPLMEQREENAIAYWEEGPLAYALVGEMEAERLLRYAAQLSETRQK